ncbi:hypothetical protein TESG_06866 [Trichophyton tonsurans CBS 112818]|uniref:Uncharacterized protein n=1 Tax=Trichophyton tonsurans (strain CBS 112818) TaxID=647933 RepID=F2S782_TRIT1|nr:hypothetical protein TESG_06866 [Trichophyton tonsurans CBS 112818]
MPTWQLARYGQVTTWRTDAQRYPRGSYPRFSRGSAVVTSVAPAYPYPHIPEAAQDRDADTLTGPFASEPFSVQRVVQRTSSSEWGDEATATARSTLEPVVNAENEELFRTFHPSLAPVACVMAVRLRRSEPYIWVVVLQPDTDTDAIGTHAGDREIHFRPPFLSAWREGVLLAGSPGPDRLPVNVRRMLTAQDLNDVRLYWPNSVGVRILISGVALMIYTNRSILHRDRECCPLTFGELEVGYILEDHVPTAPRADTHGQVVGVGHAVALAEAAPPAAALGLRLRLRNGVEAITVVTHGFVPHSQGGVMEHFSYWVNNAKKALSRFYRSPLGKTVWLANTNTKVGSIAYTYDEPHPSRPYPSGYKHDLSLVVGQLVDLKPPWGIQQMKWAEYQDTLDNAGSAFICRFNSPNDSAAARRGHIPTEQAPRALVEGTEYLWDRDNLTSSASLIWRTVPASLDVKTWSGSALCLGSPSDRAIQVVVFQNFQCSIRRDGTVSDPNGPTTFDYFKGGFLLPEEIRQAEIILNPQEFPVRRQFPSEPTSDPPARGHGRKEFSSPC